MTKIKRAVILAAGRGTRLEPLTDTCAKPLVKVCGKPIIQWTIDMLHRNCIKEIYVITGYLSEQFDYLKNQGIVLIRNDAWDKGSNLLSTRVAGKHLDDCVLIDGDTIVKRINTSVDCSGYTAVWLSEGNEWKMSFDEKTKKVIKVIADLSLKKDFYSLRCPSYWIGKQAKQYRELLKVTDPLSVNYTDDVAIRVSGLRAFIEDRKNIIEVDNMNDYNQAQIELAGESK